LQNEGSGFIGTAEGHIFTNYHVVEGAKKIFVKLKDGRDVEAKLIGYDDKTDIAVVKIEAPNIRPLPFANSDELRVGELVFTIGTPYNLDYTFTFGCVSGLGRTNLNVSTFEEYIQTDASINPGNSGGPLLDLDGRAIGMTTLINGINRGLGFAIPINMVNEVAQELIRSGRIVRPWLGLGIEGLEENPGNKEMFAGIEKGVIVRTISPNSAAFDTDIRAGDVILDVSGVPVGSTRELQKEVLKRKVGEAITLRLFRKGKQFQITLKTTELPVAPESDLLLPPEDGEPDRKEKKRGSENDNEESLSKSL